MQNLSREELATIGITEDNKFHVKHEILDWHRYFLTIADLISKRSPDAQTQHGCILVSSDRKILATGYNGYPSGAPDSILPNIREGGHKYFALEHAEINCLLQAATTGISVKSCTAYITGRPCHSCARRLVSCGIVNWYIGNKMHKETEQENLWFRLWQSMYKVQIVQIDI